MRIDFKKATASGNDFVMIDARTAQMPTDYSGFVKAACDRKFGIGADGVIFIENDADSDFLMRYFNADGSEGTLCGNGARSSAKFMSGKTGKNFVVFKAVGKIYKADILAKTVKLFLPDLEEKIVEYDFDINGKNIHSYFINTGSPHVIVFEDAFPDNTELEKLDVFKLGKEIRYHNLIAPGGANINFVKIIDNNSIRIRTYERGVEDETLACGTGSIASAITSVAKRGLKAPISIFTHGGDKFEVLFDIKAKCFANLSLEGSAVMVFDGTCYFDNVNKTISHK